MLSEMWLLDVTPAVLIGIGLLLVCLLRLIALHRPSVLCLSRRSPSVLHLSHGLRDESKRDIGLSSDELSELLLPMELPRTYNNEVTNTKKKGQKARCRKRSSDSGHANVHPIPKAPKKLVLAEHFDIHGRVSYGMKRQLNLVPAGLSRPDIHGMRSYEIKVLEFIEHGTSSLLGISGNRGMGKSTLLRLVYTSTKRDPSFHYILFVVAGIGFTANTLKGVLASHIGLGPMPMVSTANHISTLLRDESFILLLDDLRESLDLSAAGLPMPLGSRQKIIFTTRNESICAEMGSAANIIRMKCLSKYIAWNLFSHNVGPEIIRANSDIEDIAKKMVAECRGIPSALCTIGRCMANQTEISEWRIAYEMLMTKRSPLHGIEEIDDESYPCLDFFEFF